MEALGITKMSKQLAHPLQTYISKIASDMVFYTNVGKQVLNVY
jgi:hypothetical protein